MIADTAIISPKARLGRNVRVGPFTIIHDNVEIADNTSIGSHCEIGIESELSDKSPLQIGSDSLIRSHSVFYESSTFGKNLVTGHSVLVRENTHAGIGLQIGSMGDFQGHCSIGDHVKTQSNVFIAQGSVLKNYIWLLPYTVLTNDPHPPSDVVKGVILEDFVVIAAMSVVLPGVTVAKGVLVGANSTVRDNPEKDTVVVGSPAKTICKTNKIKLKDGSDLPAYPWRRHFHRGYPEEVVKEWLNSVNDLDLNDYDIS